MQAAPSAEGFDAEAAVLGHAARDEGMRELHEDRPPPAEQQHDFAVDRPGDRKIAAQRIFARSTVKRETRWPSGSRITSTTFDVPIRSRVGKA